MDWTSDGKDEEEDEGFSEGFSDAVERLGTDDDRPQS